MPDVPTAEVVLSTRGRLTLPAAVRCALGLTAGARFLLTVAGDGSLRLRPHRAVGDHNRGLLADLAGADSLVGELAAERRSEAKREP